MRCDTKRNDTKLRLERKCAEIKIMIVYFLLFQIGGGKDWMMINYIPDYERDILIK